MHSTIRVILPFLAALLISGCPKQADDGPPRPIEPPDTNLCEVGCANLNKLGCEEGKGSDPNDPTSCKNDCEYIQKQGLVNLSVKCWTEITECSQLETDCRDNAKPASSAEAAQ